VDRWASFDCYGTLIDWEGGIGDAMARLWPDANRERLLARYHQAEPGMQKGSAMPYREVMARTLAAVAEVEGLDIPPGREDVLGESLPDWPAFPDVPASLQELQRRGWKIAILSNTDPDLLAGSIRRIGVEPDLAITAREAGSYKPAHGHWLRFWEATGANRTRHVHVAASPFHDLAPAAELDVPAVWINRLGGTTELPRVAELPDLTALADILDGLVRA
jgi:2-haloacid dehalogenase